MPGGWPARVTAGVQGHRRGGAPVARSRAWGSAGGARRGGPRGGGEGGDRASIEARSAREQVSTLSETAPGHRVARRIGANGRGSENPRSVHSWRRGEPGSAPFLDLGDSPRSAGRALRWSRRFGLRAFRSPACRLAAGPTCPTSRAPCPGAEDEAAVGGETPRFDETGHARSRSVEPTRGARGFAVEGRRGPGVGVDRGRRRRGAGTPAGLLRR